MHGRARGGLVVAAGVMVIGGAVMAWGGGEWDEDED
jgi:hypothetical protein